MMLHVWVFAQDLFLYYKIFFNDNGRIDLNNQIMSMYVFVYDIFFFVIFQHVGLFNKWSVDGMSELYIK